MQKILTSIAILGFAVMPRLGICAKSDVGETESFARKITGTKNWTQLLSAAGDSLSNSTKQFLNNTTNGLEFPNITFRGSSIQVQDPNGTRVTVRFEAHGRVFLDGTEWQIHPLAPPKEEIKRISSIISQRTKIHSSFLENFFPKAYAFPNNSGVATAAFEVSTGWKSKQCGEAQLSGTQSQECPLMTVAMKSPSLPINDQTSKLWPITMTCPAASDAGTLELISKNQLGMMRRVRVTYKAHNPESVELSTAPANGAFKVLDVINLDPNNSDKFLPIGQTIAIQANSIKNGVCEGSPQDRIQYLSALEKNRQILKQPQQADNSDDDKGDTQRAL